MDSVQIINTKPPSVRGARQAPGAYGGRCFGEGMTKTRQFVSGETIIRENDIGETAYVIEQGRVKVTKKRGGRTVHLARRARAWRHHRRNEHDR